MALGATALTTLDTMLDELGLTSDGSTQDARLERYIMAASEQFASLCDRSLHYAADHVERVKCAGGIYLCVSDHLPIVSVTSIVYDPRDGTTTTVAASDYAVSDDVAGKIERVNGAWANTAISVQRIEPTPTGRALNHYKVTYTGGYVTPQQDADDATLTRTLPYDIEDAVIQHVTMQWRAKGQDRSVKSKKVGPASVTYNGHTVPPAFADAVRKYKRRAFA